jgi:AcrR family transcriptional regulator
MSKKHGSNKENLEATRRIFLNIARKEFSSKGYYNASTADIVEASGMARGSLYYHFGDKKGLFKAVYEELMFEMRDSVQKDIETKTDSWDAFMTSCMSIYDLCMIKETRRIIVDVHTALAYRERIEILQRTLLQQMQTLIDNAIRDGHFKGHNSRTLIMLVFGMISETGRGFEVAEDIPKARADIGHAFSLLMEQARA